jgi:hypothetical protein
MHSANEADVVVQGEALNDEFGSSVAGGSDVNGDGADDLLVGAAQFSAGLSGKAYVFHGPLAGFVSAADADAELSGEARGDLYGDSVALPGDVNGDGLGDVLVGSEFSNSLAAHSGRAFLHLAPLAGNVGVATATTVLTGAAGDTVGAAVAPAGDLDGDGRADLLVGASGFEGTGFAQVLRGADLAPAPLRVSVTAPGGPVQIPAGGGSFEFRVVIRNLTAETQTVELWTSLLAPPARTPRSPVLGPVEISLPPNGAFQRTFTQNVPGSFPSGRSLLVANVRSPADTAGDLANLAFTKAPAAD